MRSAIWSWKTQLRLKKLVAEQALDINILKEVFGENLSPTQKRKAGEHVKKKGEISERRACRAMALSQPCLELRLRDGLSRGRTELEGDLRTPLAGGPALQQSLLGLRYAT
jgi:hypothetical protein